VGYESGTGPSLSVPGQSPLGGSMADDESIHTFNFDDAIEYGLPGAILLKMFRHFDAILQARNDYPRYFGLCWVRAPKKSLALMFPYLTERQIKKALNNLVDDGMIYQYDFDGHGNWYAFGGEDNE